MISVVIPTFNEAARLEATIVNLRSALSTIEHEIIVSDGSSTDDTIDIAQRLADKTIVYHGEGRQTIGQARNMGAAAANGEFLVFVDADVRIVDDAFFSRALRYFETDSRVVALTVAMHYLPEEKRFWDSVFEGMITVSHFIQNTILRHGSGSGEFQMVRAGAFKKVGGYDETIVVAEDNELYWRLAKIGRTIFSPHLRVYHSARRPHELGWPRLLWHWAVNGIWVLLFRRSVHKEWKPVR